MDKITPEAASYNVTPEQQCGKSSRPSSAGSIREFAPVSTGAYMAEFLAMRDETIGKNLGSSQRSMSQSSCGSERSIRTGRSAKTSKSHAKREFLDDICSEPEESSTNEIAEGMSAKSTLSQVPPYAAPFSGMFEGDKTLTSKPGHEGENLHTQPSSPLQGRPPDSPRAASSLIVAPFSAPFIPEEERCLRTSKPVSKLGRSSSSTSKAVLAVARSRSASALGKQAATATSGTGRKKATRRSGSAGIQPSKKKIGTNNASGAISKLEPECVGYGKYNYVHPRAIVVDEEW